MPIFCSHLLALPSSLVLSSGLARLVPSLEVHESNLSTTIIMLLWVGFISLLNLEFCYTNYLVATYWLVISKEVQLLTKSLAIRKNAINLEENWAQKNWCFWSVVLEKTLESSLDSKEIKPVNTKGINPVYSLEGLMLKLKLQFFGYLIWRADSLEKMLGKNEGKRRRGW